MTVEEYFEEWWTPKELPEKGFNKTAMLDFAEMYHKKALHIHDFVMPSLPIERFDAENWLGENKDIWNHPRITDRTDKESYDVADLMAEFANQFFRQ